MTADPAALASLTRDELIEMARLTGVEKPEPLTRAELIDEIVRRNEHDEQRRKQMRGWFGVARDLVASLVEQGLHLPDTARRIRGSSEVEPVNRAPVATVTLAEIFAKQGHRRKALAILADVLAVEPEHDVARQLQTALLAETGPSMPPPEPEPEPEPEREDAAFTRVVAGRVAVYWELAQSGLDQARLRWPAARPVLRVAIVTPSAQGTRRSEREVELEGATGHLTLDTPSPRSIARVAVGLREGQRFWPIVVAAELAADASPAWVPWGTRLDGAALARAAAALEITA